MTDVGGGGNNSHVPSGRVGDPEADGAALAFSRRALLSLAWIAVAVVARQSASSVHARLAGMVLPGALAGQRGRQHLASESKHAQQDCWLGVHGEALGLQADSRRVQGLACM